MTEYTIDKDIKFLRDLARYFGEDDETIDRLHALADRLEEVEALLPLLFMYVPLDEIDRTLDVVNSGGTTHASKC